MQLIDPRRNREQFDAGHAQPLQVRNGCRMRQAFEPPLHAGWDVGVSSSEAAHVQFVEHGFTPGATGLGQALTG